MADGAGDGAGAGAAVGAASVVKVARDYTKHKDGVEWAVSGVLGTLFEKESYAHRFAGKRVLELGSGLGHLALRLAALGGTVTACERGKVLGALKARIAAAPAVVGPGSITVAQCDWGEPHWEAQRAALEARGPFDIIVMSELYYDDDVHEDLVWTLLALCRHNRDHPVVVYSGFKNRPYSLQFLALLHDTEQFNVGPVPEADIDLLGVESSPGDEVLLHIMQYTPT